MIDISGHLRVYKNERGFEDNENYIIVNSCGYQKFITKNLFCIREDGRLDYLLAYITKGKGRFIYRGNVEEVQEGNIIIYKPFEGQKFSYSYEDNTEVYWVHFTGFGSRVLLEKSGLSSGGIFYLGLDNQYIELYKKMIHELQIRKPHFDQIVNAAFIELIALIARAGSTSDIIRKKKGNANLDGVLELMHNSYNLNWSMSDFARECNISPYRFIHKFKEHMGMSPLEYLTRIRVEKAKELLVSTTLNISEISEVIGYENPLYFSRVFKKAENMSPTQYRYSNL